MHDEQKDRYCGHRTVTEMLISTRPTSELVRPICLKITYCRIIRPGSAPRPRVRTGRRWQYAASINVGDRNSANNEVNNVRQTENNLTTTDSGSGGQLHR